MSSTEMPDERRSRRYIHVDAYGPQSDVQLPPSSKIKIKLVAGGNVQKLSILQVKPNPVLDPLPTVTWIIDVGDLSDSTKIEFELYDCRSFHLPKKLLIGRTKSKNMSDLVKGAPMISVYNNATPRLRIWTLNAYQINIKEAVEDGVNATNVPRTSSEGAGDFLQILQVAGPIFDKVSEIHPIAQVVWGILSFGLKTYKNQAETKKLIVELCTTLKSIHQEANNDRDIQMQEDLTEIYSFMFEKVFECCVFVNHYVKKEFLGRFITLNPSDTIKKYNNEFDKFHNRLERALRKNINKGVTVLNTSDELNKLIAQHKGTVETSPKCRCLKGTHIKTLEHLNSWIKHPDGVGRVLWCHGLAGTGKSSLAGTLHDNVINFNPTQEVSPSQTQSRLGAFIRYDRSTGKSSVSHLILAIAYSLGQLDERIGSAIAKVVKAHGPGIGGVSVKTQYDGLLGGPLKTVPELVNEGPLVIIIDGLDECSDITETPDLALNAFMALSKGFQDLTFIRLVVFSRHVDPITGMFEKSITVHPFSLNEPLDPILNDIKYFIKSELAKAGKNSDRFRKVMEHYPKATEQLSLKANGLFIWASIACRYLLQHKSRKAMEVLLKTNTPDNAAGHSNTGNSELKALKALHNLYITALDEASGGDSDIEECIKKVLGAIMVAQIPLTQDDLNKIVLSKKDTSAQDILDKLGSVVEKYDDDDSDDDGDDETDPKRGGFIQLIHKSFDDFLTHQSSHHRDSWFINIKDHQRKFAQQCLSVLTSFLKEWTEGSHIPSHIQNYALLGPLWHIEWFDKSDVKDLCVLFEDDLSAKWFKVTAETAQSEHLLDEIIEVLCWVDGLKDVDSSFRQLIYHVCQCAEFTLLSTERQPTIESQNVIWHNILPYLYYLLNCNSACFSVSTDSHVLIGIDDDADIVSWDINDIGFQAIPAWKQASSFFNLEKELPALKDLCYHVLGHLVACQSMFMGDLSGDDHEACWEVINGNSLFMAQPGDQSESALISISDIQTSHCHHYLFNDLKHCHLLLYAAGFIIINTQTTVLMRIDVNATVDQHKWKNIVEGDVLQAELLPIRPVGQGS
ncbi:hypothetical protein EDD85DRAFT_130610 [Armillaria nabsnona]|nr:hypothetical protein EDD85DRAFT_130610 [Armillaria nabsnona]